MTTTGRTVNADAPPGSVRVRASLPGEERRSRGAGVASLLVHVGAILLALRLSTLVPLPETRGSTLFQGWIDPIPGGGGGGGRGGDALIAILAPPPAAMEITPPLTIPPPPPVPEVKPEVVPEKPAETAPAKAEGATSTTQAAAGVGGGDGGGTGAGTGTGTGSGAGPGSGSGTGPGTGAAQAEGMPAEPRDIILPPKAPKALRGKRVEVTFSLDEQGRVRGVSVAPPIEDRGYAREFADAMSKYLFKPARDPSGRAVASSYPVVVTF